MLQHYRNIFQDFITFINITNNVSVIDEECNSVYMGHNPLSEEESQALSYVLNSLAVDMIAFINVKGFGQYITIPYGNVDDISNNHDIVVSIFLID